jgi:uncharacterized OsmC-like protein
MTITNSTNVDNGVNVEALLGAREAFGQTPEAAQFQWRARTQWVSGTHTRSVISDFSGLGENQSRREDHTVEADHPEQFASEDNASTPAEIALAALGACLTAGVATVAQHRGIQLRSVTATIEGDMDLRGIMGVDPDVRNGYQRIGVSFAIDADATREELEALVAQSQKRSAVFDVITNPTVVTVGLD